MATKRPAISAVLRMARAEARLELLRETAPDDLQTAEQWREYARVLEGRLAEVYALLPDLAAGIAALVRNQRATKGRKPQRKNALTPEQFTGNQKLAREALKFRAQHNIASKTEALRRLLKKRGKVFDKSAHGQALKYMSTLDPNKRKPSS
jgi:hypothetical protein